MEFPLGVPPNADAGGSEEKVKCRGYGQSDLGKRDLERHFAPVSSQLRTSPAWLQVQPKAGRIAGKPFLTAKPSHLGTLNG